MSMIQNGKQIAIDENAWKILVKTKEEIRKQGRHPSLSDAIRYLHQSHELLTQKKKEPEW